MKKFLNINIREAEGGFILQVVGKTGNTEYLCATLEDLQTKIFSETGVLLGAFNDVFNPEETEAE